MRSIRTSPSGFMSMVILWSRHICIPTIGMVLSLSISTASTTKISPSHFTINLHVGTVIALPSTGRMSVSPSDSQPNLRNT